MLYDILINRKAVNILKELSENDKNKQYSTQRAHFGLSKDNIEAIQLLCDNGLVYSEDGLISISEKGKRFIDTFDKLVALFNEEEIKRDSNVEIKYDLTDVEKRILLLILKLQQEKSGPVSLSTVTREMYPYSDVTKKKCTVSRQISKLEQLNLVERNKLQREVFFQLTYPGMKVAKSQVVKEISRIL